MKTMLLTVYDRIQIKNLLRTNFLSGLTENGIRVVLLVPKKKKDYYSREFAAPLVVVEGVEEPSRRPFSFLVEQLAQASIRTSTVWSFYVQRSRVQKKYLRYLCYLISYVFLSNTAGYALIRLANSILFPRGFYRRYFDEYHPDLVFASNITAPIDRVITREARIRGVRVIGANKSWDTLSSKGYLDIQADILLVQNDLQAQEAREIQRYAGEIIVAGYPWFDFFLDTRGILSREEFCRQKKLDPLKKIIYFFPSAKFVDPSLEEHVSVLSDLIEKRRIVAPAQILVVARPKYEFDISRVRALPNVIVYVPPTGAYEAALDWEEVSHEEIEDFRNQTFHADVIVNAVSTMSVEGALMDRPIISTNFDIVKTNYWLSVAVWHKSYNWLRLMETGGVSEARSADELATLVNSYLDHPEMCHDGRVRIVRQQNHFVDAFSTSRWISVVKETIRGAGDSLGV